MYVNLIEYKAKIDATFQLIDMSILLYLTNKQHILFNY